jgi:molecular chaperone IbpA
MTRTLSLRSLDIPSIHKFGIGFDNIFNELDKLTQANQTNYPPYNILKHNEDSYELEIAVTGFAPEEITVEIDQNQLVVKGERSREDEAETQYLHKGLAALDHGQVDRAPADHLRHRASITVHCLDPQAQV